MGSTEIIAYLSLLVQDIPVMLVLLIGMVLAIVFWSRHPGVSRLTLIALLLFLARQLLGPLVSLWLTLNQRPLGGDARGLGFAMLGIGIVSSVIQAIGYGLLLAAVFAGRNATLMATPRRLE